MKPPPRKTEDEMTMKELREYRKLKEAEAEADRIEAEARETCIVNLYEIQGSLIDSAKREIRIVKSKIDDMKERHHAYHSEYGYINKLEKLYVELATAEHNLQMIKLYPFNAPITTDTSNRNHDWDKELYHEATSQYEDLRDNCPFSV